MTEDSAHHLRFHAPHGHLASPFGSDRFGLLAETFARFFGTPKFIIGQTVVVIIWLVINSVAVALRWDPYPFILLNLAFSTQAAYAAPLILLAQTRQADRDKAYSEADAKHREDISESLYSLLKQNTELTEEVASLSRQLRQLTQDIHARVVTP